MGSICGPAARTPRSSVLIPLYIYPSHGAWDDLYQALRKHPSLDFVVVVNPNSGPGLNALPDANYTREISTLNSFSNVHSLGYVALHYTNKPEADALKEVQQYAGWAKADRRLAMKGIFFDETPANAEAHTYLDSLATTIRNNASLPNEIIVMNPGVVPDASLLSVPDLTVIFEERYVNFAKLNSTVRLANPKRKNLACVLHTIPPATSAAELKTTVRDMRDLCSSVFLTIQDDAYYHSLDPRFEEFLSYMDP